MTEAAPGLQQSRSRSNPGASKSRWAGREGKEDAASCLASSVLVKGRGQSSVKRDGVQEWLGTVWHHVTAREMVRLALMKSQSWGNVCVHHHFWFLWGQKHENRERW